MTTPRPLVLRNGLVFDGTDQPPQLADVLIQNHCVHAVAPRLAVPDDAQAIDCTDHWVMPGMIDLHTHYEAELEAAPSLSESIRHGITSVVLGSCGLSMAVGDPTALTDMFCRVEGIPRRYVLPLLQRVQDWDSPAGYFEHLSQLPLGPNVSSFLGHSTIRADAMGLERSLSRGVKPTRDEYQRMEGHLNNALDAGYLGLSVNTLPWDKMDGDEFRSRPTPSVFASWREYRRLMRTLRRRDAILQAVPNLATRLDIPLFFAAATGIFRKPLRMTLIALLDPKVDRLAPRLVAGALRVINTLLRGNLRFQTLPNPFELFTDGLEVPVMEELGAGTQALHETDPDARAALLRDPTFRAQFKRDWSAWFPGRAYHRDLAQTEIIDAPDRSLVGHSFADIAQRRGIDPLEAFLDLQAEHGNALRWFTVVANDRPHVVDWIVNLPDVLIGFSDAGAHLRNMAYYNFGLRMLARVKRSHDEGRPIMSLARAVHRVTGEIADWLRLDAGALAVGRRADITVVNPAALGNASLDRAVEAPMTGFPGLHRMVCRNDAVVPYVLINGRMAWQHGQPAAELGQQRGFGQVLRAH